MKTRTIGILIGAYVLMVVVTFGHAYKSEWATATEYQKANGVIPGLAFFESLCWPFYWSAEFWK